MEDKGYYAQYLYGKNYMIPSKRFEALGEALAVLFDVADAEQSKSIISKSPLTDYGVTCIYPQIPGIPPYHNNAIWPFVQSYWNLAAAKVGNEKVLNQGLASIYRAAGLFLTNYENMVADNGDFKGTEINSHRMLWSMAGNLSMVYRVFIGMHFEEDRLVFEPVIPKNYGGTRTLNNFKYRNANLNITVEGFGNKIASVIIDGKKADKAIIPATFIGNHTVKITMSNNDFSTDAINLVENKFTLANPNTTLNGDTLTWKNNPEAVAYQVYKNGKLVDETTTASYQISDDNYAEYAVSAVDVLGQESFMSEPLIYSKAQPLVIEPEDFVAKSDLNYVNYSGKGFVEVSTEKNTKVSLPIVVDESGEYFIDIKYSN
jgi:hypothetical protein